jgi:hypothetical protein
MSGESWGWAKEEPEVKLSKEEYMDRIGDLHGI